jgi:flavin reductase (DIM6/NTAB) family NADH-FMN oxidoreductase RutF
MKPAQYRTVMGRFATGVTIVTVTGPEGPVGLTANAVASLSLDPLLMLVCFDNQSRTLSALRERRRFGVNVLSAGQKERARLFASKAPEARKFDAVPHRLHDGIAVVEGALAWVACDLERLVPGGDHTIGIGAVRAAECSDGEPLVWYRGAYGSFAP